MTNPAVRRYGMLVSPELAADPQALRGALAAAVGSEGYELAGEVTVTPLIETFSPDDGPAIDLCRAEVPARKIAKEQQQ